MHALHLLLFTVFVSILLLPADAPGQSFVEIEYRTLAGQTGSGKLNLPLYALPHSKYTVSTSANGGQKFTLSDMEYVIFAGDTLFRRFPEVAPDRLWQLLLWGESHHLYRTVDKGQSAAYVLYHSGQAQHLHAKNFRGVLNRERPWRTKAVIKPKTPYKPASLMRAARRLNKYANDVDPSYVYTPFELSRWQLEAGARIYLQSPYILGTVRKRDFGVAHHVGLNYRPFTHRPYLWAHTSFSRQGYDGDHTAIAWREPEYLRTLRFTEWQWAIGGRLEAAPQWGLAPYLGLNLILTIPSHMTYTQELAPNRTQPSELPFRIEQTGQGRLSAGPGFTLGLRIQMGNYSSLHLQYQSENIDRRVLFTAPAGSSRLAVDREVEWNQSAQQILAAHLQFRIR